MKRILITGKNSYIGTSVEKWLLKETDKYQVDTIDVKGEGWKEYDFSKYDVVFHVAGIAHVKETRKNKDLYFKVNRDLAIKVAKKAKKNGVKQFIFMSTMAVYGEEGKIGKEVIISKETVVNPKTLYAISKIEAENEINILNDKTFKVVIMRPPMVYGPNCPGNYSRLEKLSKITPVFPLIYNQRSMIHIDNLCQYVDVYIDREVSGFYFPQDNRFQNTSLLVKELAKKNGRDIHLSKMAGVLIKLFGKRIRILNKVFGNLVYEK